MRVFKQVFALAIFAALGVLPSVGLADETKVGSSEAEKSETRSSLVTGFHLLNFQAYFSAFGVGTVVPNNLLTGGAGWQPEWKSPLPLGVAVHLGGVVAKNNFGTFYPLFLMQALGYVQFGGFRAELGGGARMFIDGAVTFQPVLSISAGWIFSKNFLKVIERVGLSVENAIALAINYQARAYIGVSF